MLILQATQTTPTQIYLCVADGVGSWRAHNVDPRLFSSRLIKNAQSIIWNDEKQRNINELAKEGWGSTGLGLGTLH